MRYATLLTLFVVGLCTHTAAGATITVGKGGGYDYSTIQAAIDAATTGDTIVVYPAAYIENINLKGKNITVRSTIPTSTLVVAATIINGNHAGSVVTFAGSELSSCVLAGFTITNGQANQGGGIRGNASLATIRYNRIHRNIGGGPEYAQGGGLHDCDGTIEHNTITSNSVGGPIGTSTPQGGGLYDCDGLIEGNVISGNWSSYVGGAQGGGLYDCDGTIDHNTITSNWVGGNWAPGGGLYDCDGLIEGNVISGNWSSGPDENMGGGLCECDGTIRNNVVSGNWCVATLDDAYGGGLKDCDGTIENNIITGNWVRGSGSGDAFGAGLLQCDGVIQNNVITSNTCSGTALAWGAGLCGCWGTIQNNVIAGNVAGNRGGGLYECRGQILNNTIYANTAPTGGGLSLTSATIRNCIVWGNAAPVGAQLDACSMPSYSCIQNWTSGGTGNISNDPQLADPAHDDFHLLPTSPCIDGGGTVPLTVDFEGDPRPCDFTSLPRGDGSDFDIGADEAISPPTFAVIWPTTGTIWQAGVVGNLTFMCADPPPPGEVCVELWKGGAYLRYWMGVPCQYSLNVVPLRLPTDLAPGPNYQIRLYWTKNAAVHAFSGRFTVAPPPTFAVTWPTTGTIWQAGTFGAVTWTCRNLPTPGQVYVDIWKGGNYVRYWTHVPVREGANSVSLRFAADLPSGPDYQIRLCWTENVAICSWSAPFSVMFPGQLLSVTRFYLYY